MLIRWSLLFNEHASGYMRRPCKGHGIGCLWLLLPKPNTGDDCQRGVHNIVQFLAEIMVNTMVLVQWRYLKYLRERMQFLLEWSHLREYTIFSAVIRTALNNLRSKKKRGGALQTECDFP